MAHGPNTSAIYWLAWLRAAVGVNPPVGAQTTGELNLARRELEGDTNKPCTHSLIISDEIKLIYFQIVAAQSF